MYVGEFNLRFMAILHRSDFILIRDLFTELDFYRLKYEVSIEHLRRV